MVKPQSDRPDRSLYQAVWRWHFIAGLLVLPFLAMMATTGGLYLFKDEITHVVYRNLIDVPPRSASIAPLSLVIGKTEAALNGQVLQITPSDRPDRSVAMIVRVPSGEARSGYADPYDGHFLGSTPYGGVMQLVRKVHSLQRFGFWTSCLIELSAGWAIVLVGTGVYMWWPRGRKGGVVTVRGTPKARVFWRDVHAVTGAFVGMVIVFLAATGMPWSLFWGVKVQTWVGMHQLYAPRAPAYTQREEMMGITTAPTPASPKSGSPKSGSPKPTSPEVNQELPWTIQRAPVPSSAPPAMPGMPGMEAPPSAAATPKPTMALLSSMPGMPGMGAPPTASGSRAQAAPIGVDEALRKFRALGVRGAFGLALPIGPKGAYVANYRTLRVQDTRTVYLDQYSGKVLGDVYFRDWYAGGKAIEWGSGVHQGREYGPLNRYVMLMGCIGVVTLAISSSTMWWKRRPKGRLGLPPAPADPRVARGLWGVMIPVGLFYPLVGASMLVALAVELLARWLRRGEYRTGASVQAQ